MKRFPLKITALGLALVMSASAMDMATYATEDDGEFCITDMDEIDVSDEDSFDSYEEDTDASAEYYDEADEPSEDFEEEIIDTDIDIVNTEDDIDEIDTTEEEKKVDATEQDPVITEEEEVTEWYTIEYIAEDGDVYDMPYDNTLYKKGELAGVVEDVPRRNGYVFLGWSPTGDPSMLYTYGWSFEMTEDMTFYAVWSSAEEERGSQSGVNSNNPRVKAINKYVKSLKGSFNPVFKIDGKVRSWQCCAFVDHVWRNAFGITRWDKEKQYTVVNSNKKIGGKRIYEFLKNNNAQPGDIIWCHDPSYAKDYNITHFMVVLGYDENGVVVSDGYEKNGKGIVWKNNQRVSYTGDHSKYFSGKCYIRLYHLNDNVGME